MKQERLSNDEFFRRLTELFATSTSQEFGSVFLTQKRLVAPADQPASPGNFADLALLEKPGPLLIRATNGARGPYIDKKIKFSTVVEPDAIDAFYIRYAEVCKTGMTALKRRDRKKNKKKKATKTEGARTVT